MKPHLSALPARHPYLLLQEKGFLSIFRSRNHSAQSITRLGGKRPRISNSPEREGQETRFEASLPEFLCQGEGTRDPAELGAVARIPKGWKGGKHLG